MKEVEIMSYDEHLKKLQWVILSQRKLWWDRRMGVIVEERMRMMDGLRIITRTSKRRYMAALSSAKLFNIQSSLSVMSTVDE